MRFPRVPTEITDAALVVRVLSGDIDAYGLLADRHFEPCARYARRMLGNAEDAEDVLQETFLRAYLALRRYQDQDRFRAWLFRILINQCRSHAKRRARQATRFVHDDGAEAVVEPAEAACVLRDALQVALDRLEPTQREALLLKYGEDLEYEEIARLTGSSISALKMRVKRARDAMRPRLQELLDE